MLVPELVGLFGRTRECGVVGGGVSVSEGFKVPNVHAMPVSLLPSSLSKSDVTKVMALSYCSGVKPAPFLPCSSQWRSWTHPLKL